MPPSHPKPLSDFLVAANSTGRFLWGAQESVCLNELVCGSSLGDAVTALAGRSVLLATSDQLTTALALIELDGIARRIILCPPDLSCDHFSDVIALGEADAVVHGPQGPRFEAGNIALQATCNAPACNSKLMSGSRSEEHTSELQSRQYLV